jgi:hypothetical protein
MTLLQKKIVEIAISYIGQKEKKNNSGFVDAIFERKMKKVGWITSWAWCACFAELVYDEAYTHFPDLKEQHEKVRKLITPSATATWNNFKAEGMVTFNPQPGYLAIWRSGTGWTGHIGIVLDSDPLKKTFRCIEGNTDSKGGREGVEVALKQRRTIYASTGSQVGLTLLGFVAPLEKKETITI